MGHHIWAWIMHSTGSDNVSGPEYGFWSGFGGDAAILGSILAAPFLLWRKHNCGVRWCPRIARHEYLDPQTGLHHHLCRKHHPEHPGKPVTADELRRRYHLHLGRQPGKG